MPFSDWELFGRKAHLVLEDEHGEFEVRTPVTGTYINGMIALDSKRIADAITLRETTVPAPPPRPVY